MATIAGISEERGVDLIMCFPSSVNVAKFKIYLDELRQKYFFDDICIYMDNLSAHRSNIARERLDELSIPYIFNPPYSQDFNGIESVFSIVKSQIKKARLEKILKGQKVNILHEIKKSFNEIDREKIINCI